MKFDEPGFVAPPHRQWLAQWLGLVAVVTTSSVALFRTGHGLTFFFDEWTWIEQRRDLSAATLLEPHNGHLSAIPVLIFRCLFAIFGLHQYGPYRVAVLAVHVLCCIVVFVALRRRVGGWTALALVTSLSLYGAAWQDLLWPFQIGFLGSIAAGVAALVTLDRTPTPRSTTCAGTLLAITLGSSGIGIPFLGAAAIMVALDRQRWRAAPAIIAPAVLYGVWYLGYGVSQAKRDNAGDVPRYVSDAARGVISSLWGWTGPATAIAFGGVVLAVVVAAFRADRFQRNALSASAALAVGYWALTALGRAQFNEPAASRYLYPGFVMLLLILGDTAGVLVRRQQLLAILAAAVMIPAVWHNIHTLRSARNGLLDVSINVRAELGALELLDLSSLEPDFQPDTARMPQVSTAAYFAAIEELGSSADSPRQIASRPEAVRRNVDALLVRAGAIELEGTSATAETEPCPDPVESVLLTPGTSILVRPSRPAAVSVGLFAPTSVELGGTANAAAQGPYRLTSQRLRGTTIKWTVSLGSPSCLNVSG